MTTMTMAEMVVRFNELAEKLGLEKRVGPKTFNSKAKAEAAIAELEAKLPKEEPAKLEEPASLDEQASFTEELDGEEDFCFNCGGEIVNGWCAECTAPDCLQCNGAEFDEEGRCIPCTKAAKEQLDGPEEQAFNKAFDQYVHSIPASVPVQTVKEASEVLAAAPMGTVVTLTVPAPPTKTIQARANELLLADATAPGIGFPYADILATIKHEYPNAKTSVACLRWYQNRLLEEGKNVPERPRSKHK